MTRLLCLLLLAISTPVHADEPTVDTLVIECRRLVKKVPWDVGSAEYKAAKKLVKAAKKLDATPEPSAQAKLRYVRFTMNTVLSCANLRKGGMVATKASEAYLAVAVKDLGVLWKDFVAKSEVHGSIWKELIRDHQRINEEYKKELEASGAKIQKLVRAIKQVFDEAGVTKK